MASSVNQKNFEMAMRAALKGPEKKKLRLGKHEFNIKPVHVEKKGNQLFVKGQISHHLKFRDDDQVNYRFTVVPGQVLSLKDIDVDIDRSFMNSVVSAIWDQSFMDVVGKLLKNDVLDTVLKVGQMSAMLKLARGGAERVYNEAKKTLDGSWVAEANFMIVNIATRVSLGAAAAANTRTHTKVDPLAFAARLRKVTPRPPVKKNPTVADHRGANTPRPPAKKSPPEADNSGAKS